jgi:NAD-dependent SIR2 family protein deacetylase
MFQPIDILAEWIRTGQAKKILVLSGAGVSVAAGIPDFRTPGTGLYDNLQKYNLPYAQAVFDVDFYRTKPQPFCTLAKGLWPGLKHSPTLTHSFLKLLSDKGLLLRLYSQNIDGLEYLAGIPEKKLVECHGHFRTASCIDCHKSADGQQIKETIVQEAKCPKCQHCGANVKPDIVFFGESLPGRFRHLLQQDIHKADLLLIMGTSLKVTPVSLIPEMVACNRVLFNRELVMDIHSGDLFVEGDCDTNVERLCTLLGWKGDLFKQNSSTKIKNKPKEGVREKQNSRTKIKEKPKEGVSEWRQRMKKSVSCVYRLRRQDTTLNGSKCRAYKSAIRGLRILLLNSRKPPGGYRLKRILHKFRPTVKIGGIASGGLKKKSKRCII